MTARIKAVMAGLMAAQMAVLSISCAGAPATAVQVSPPVESESPSQPQPKIEAPVPVKEVMVAGSPGSILANPEPDKAVNIEFILDASGSMLEKIGDKSREDIAKEVIAELAGELPPSIQLALRAYGHRYPESDKARSCEDIEQLTQLGSGNAGKLAEQLATIKPSGWTAMGRSIEQAGQAMASLTQSINNIVLLSDGRETCDGKPIEVAQSVKDGPGKLTVHTIGFAIDEDARKELQEIASVSGGSYNEAADAQGLIEAVGRALIAARSGTFLRTEVSAERDRRVSVPVWLTDSPSGKKVHELRSWVDSPVAAGVYDILVGTAPRVVYRGIEIKAHTRTTIKLNAGGIRVELADAQGEPLKAMTHLLDRDSGAPLRDFSTWYNQPALPGSYDIRIDSNPPITRRNVQVSEKSLALVDLRVGRLWVDATGLGGTRPNWEIELRDTEDGNPVYRSLVGREQPVMAGDYRLVVLTRPQIDMPVKIGPGEVKTVKLDTGILRVELLDNQGRRANLPVRLQDGQGKEAGSFNTWEDANPLPGTYQIVIPTQPETRQAVQVSPTQPSIVRIHSSQ